MPLKGAARPLVAAAAASAAWLVSLAQAGAGDGAAVDERLLQLGQAQFIESCAECHQATGAGQPPDFPALAGNPQLQQLGHIIETVRFGRGAMPPHPKFDAQMLAGLATFIRNSWGNSYGGVTIEDVEEALQIISPTREALQAADKGWYTEEQARRGAGYYLEHCAECHGADFVPDDFATGLTGAAFAWHWNGRTVYDLLETIRTSMPYGDEGSLPSSTYIDIVAYLLEVNGFPAGDQELQANGELLSQFHITR